MNDYNAFISELIEQDTEFKKEVDLLELKYTIINELIAYRKKYGLTQTEFAEKINVKQQMISRFEKGEVDARLSFISKVLRGINKNISFNDSDFVKPNQKLSLVDKSKTKKSSFTFEKTDYKIFDLTA